MDDEDRYTRITLRIPKDLHQVLTTAAERTSKSLNAEIIGRLQASVPDDTESAALEVLPEGSALRHDLQSSIAQLHKLRNEKAILELRMYLSARTDTPMHDLRSTTARLEILRHEIALCEQSIQQFKLEALANYGPGSVPKHEADAKARKPKP
ncbi:toxin-antitoxin system HicB family antitoxin [Paracidovorax konjaci]|uniref:HicB family protein n=1 Tax=Paracidovorax konjaci TaxID=32040 RepID=A0A1I1YIY4_9BURK|nr:toxin-antitoxin system HicB family antitoxin [Paracidovorax konjaci]SFE19555.1 HicB family protein [Paracidovorax konjaci]